LDAAPGLPDGQAVSVTHVPTLAPGDGLRRAFGSWSEDPAGIDEFLRQIRDDRRRQ
jgi:hypothetical protein